MIYTKKANFPYPLYTNDSMDYQDPLFDLDIDMGEDTEDYILEIHFQIRSSYLMRLLQSHNAQLLLIIKSRDNQFHIIEDIAKPVVKISKSRLCLNTRTVMQLILRAREDISYEENHDLVAYFDEIRSEILIHKGCALGFSNTVTFDGSQKKPYDLFEKVINPHLSSDIEIEVGNETIKLIYRDETIQFSGMAGSKELNYVYLYMGLQKALMRFILDLNPDHPDEGVTLYEIHDLPTALDDKLYQLMKAKKIEELTFDNLDTVIYRITDNLVKKYTEKIRGMNDGN